MQIAVRTLQGLIAVGFFSALVGCGHNGHEQSFQSEDAFRKNRAKQIAMAPETVAVLRTHGVTNDTNLKLEFFFYTDTNEKAAGLAKKLAALGYETHQKPSAHDPKQFLITGWTTKLKMSEESVVKWTAQMCDLGRENDCDFDGWGTNPDQ